MVERVIWKEEGLQALPEEEKEEKEVELKVMKEQGNWVYTTWEEMKFMSVILMGRDHKKSNEGMFLSAQWLEPIFHTISSL